MHDDNKLTTKKTVDKNSTKTKKEKTKEEEDKEEEKTKEGENKAGPGVLDKALDKILGWTKGTDPAPNPKSDNKEGRNQAAITKNAKNANRFQRTKIGALFSALQNDNVLTIGSDQLKASQKNEAQSQHNPDYIQNNAKADQKAKQERKEQDEKNKKEAADLQKANDDRTKQLEKEAKKKKDEADKKAKEEKDKKDAKNKKIKEGREARSKIIDEEHKAQLKRIDDEYQATLKIITDESQAESDRINDSLTIKKGLLDNSSKQKVFRDLSKGGQKEVFRDLSKDEQKDIIDNLIKQLKPEQQQKINKYINDLENERRNDIEEVKKLPENIVPTAHNNNKANNHIGDATNNTFQGTQPVVADKKKNTKLKQQTQNVDNTTPKNNQNTEANNQAVGDQVKSFKRQLELNNKIIQPSQIQPSQIVKGGVKIS